MTSNQSDDGNAGDALDLTTGVTGLLLFPVTLVVVFLMIFAYKVYKNTFQRFILYYVVLGLCFQLSCALQILELYRGSGKERICVTTQYIYWSSLYSWSIYSGAVNHCLLLLVPCLLRGTPIAKRTGICMECICVPSAIICSLILASVREMIVVHRNDGDLSSLCYKEGVQPVSSNTGLFLPSIYLALCMELILVNLLLCIIFCFIRQRMHNEKTSTLLRKSVYHLAINAFVNGIYAIGAAYDNYWLHIHRSDENYYDEYKTFHDSPVNLMWNVLFILAVGASTIVQAGLILGSRRIKDSLKKFHNKCWYHRKSNANYDTLNGTDTATNPVSTRKSMLSYTHFSIPHTDGFVSINNVTNNGNECCVRVKIPPASTE